MMKLRLVLVVFRLWLSRPGPVTSSQRNSDYY